MAMKLMREGDRANTNYKEYIVDTTTDLDGVKKEFGTMVVCLEDQKVYVCGSDLEWVAFG